MNRPCTKVGGCDQGSGHVGACAGHRGVLNLSGVGDARRFRHDEPSNPWASFSPDCPRGHHSRRVFLWSYDDDDPWPWYCADCRRRFSALPTAMAEGAGTSSHVEAPAP